MKTYGNYAKDLKLLMYKHVKGLLTAAEKEKLDEFINRSPVNAELFELLTTPDNGAKLLQWYARNEKDWEGYSFKAILDKRKRKRRPLKLQLWVVAATVLMLLIVSTWFLIWYLNN